MTVSGARNSKKGSDYFLATEIAKKVWRTFMVKGDSVIHWEQSMMRENDAFILCSPEQIRRLIGRQTRIKHY